MSWRPNAPLRLYLLLSRRGGTFQPIDLWARAAVASRQQTLNHKFLLTLSALAFLLKWRGDALSISCGLGLLSLVHCVIPSHLLEAMNLPCGADLQVCQERRKKWHSASLPCPTVLLRPAQALQFREMRSCQGSCMKFGFWRPVCKVGQHSGLQWSSDWSLQSQGWCWSLAASFRPPRNLFLFFLFPIIAGQGLSNSPQLANALSMTPVHLFFSKDLRPGRARRCDLGHAGTSTNALC